MKTSKIILYDEPTVPQIQLQKLKKFIIDTFPVKIEIRKNFFHNLETSNYEKIASARVFDLKKPFKKYNPSTEEIQIEVENKDRSNKDEMVLYDGFEFQKIASELISGNESKEETLHIIFTNKLTCTFDESDFRYHARVWVGANPIIISTTGMIEAPAKPKQYYLDLMTNFSKENISEIKRKYKGQFLEYNDPRISQIVEGCILQIIFYYNTGEVFCDNNQCRLYNAHWQKDLLISQIENKKICEKHKEVLIKIRNNIV